MNEIQGFDFEILDTMKRGQVIGNLHAELEQIGQNIAAKLGQEDFDGIKTELCLLVNTARLLGALSLFKATLEEEVDKGK